MLVSDIIARLEARVDDLAGRVQGAAELAELVRRKALPQASPFAFVLPLGLHARNAGEAGAGYFVQNVDEVFAVLLVVRASGDITGGKALPAIDALVQSVVAGVCGWGPSGAMGVFSLRRGQLASAEAGTVIYQLDFAIQSQVRVLT